MTEVVCGGGGTLQPIVVETLTSPDTTQAAAADCNSNPTTNNIMQEHHFVSSTTSQDAEFIQDNSDYQWFIDYGYRDGSNVQHTSVLSSICTSYTGIDDLGFYDAMSKNLDANLAEADMESFRTEDIHSLLTTLPTMCTDLQMIQEKNREGEMYASMSGSLMEKIDLDSSISQQTSSQGGDSNGLIDTMSICKSELLFSPVKEVPMPGHNYSVDSLDCELPTEEDIMLTCQANKNNYTIAFEGSVTMYSEASEEHELDKTESNLICNNKKEFSNKLDTSMAKSDLGLTTWSKLKKRSSEMKLRRHPSGNNNTTSGSSTQFSINSFTSNAFKSQSMPNLYKQKGRFGGSVNHHFIENKSTAMNTSSIDSYSNMQRFPSGCIKVFDIQHQTNSGSLFSDIASSMDGFDSSCSDHQTRQQTKTPAPNLNLVKRFIKQKSISAEGVDMDKSSASEYFQSGTSAGSLDNRYRNRMSTSINDNDHLNCDNNRYSRIQNQLNNWLRTDEIADESTEIKTKQFHTSSAVEDEIKNIKRKTLFNVNNNNSIDRSDSPIKKDNIEIVSSAESASISMCSSSDATETTKFQRYSPRNRLKPNQILQTRLELVDRSMQTSVLQKRAEENLKFVEPSFLNKLKSDGKQKPVYVLYPNYTLPSLDFLKENTDDLTKIFLFPQKFVPYQDEEKPKKRPFSCNDIETLKKKGFGHVKDWESLTFLLPNEYRQILAEVPEVIEEANINPDELLRHKEKPLFCVTPPMKHKVRPQSCDLTGFVDRTNVSSSSSTATQPSSGYRGSSTMLLTDSVQNATNFNPLFIYRYDSVTSSEASFLMSEKKIGAPPLPKRSTSLPNGEQKGQQETCPPRPALPKSILRKSLAENYAKNKNRKNFSQDIDDSYPDEGVDAGNDSSMENNDILARPPTPPLPKALETSVISNTSQDELQQLEDFLKQSGFSCSENEDWDDHHDAMKLRSCVNKFLSLKINQNRKKSVSFSNHLNVHNDLKFTPQTTPPRHGTIKGLVDLPICEEAETSSEERSPKNSPKRNKKISNDIVENKTALITAVKDAVDQIIDHFAVANNREELENLGDSETSPACAKLLLSTLCPALYAIFSDGLKPNIETAFGTIGNSVWQVIEGSSHDGPLTKSLNELVMRINTEDVITEGLIKFNSFVFGLLNVQSLDVWLSYLRMRESILRKHYNPDSLLLMAHTGGSNIRGLVDLLIASLQPLNMLPFRIDLMFEYRQLHISLKRMGSFQSSSPVHFKISPTKSQLSSKQWALFKIVRSIQNSLTQSQDDEQHQLIEPPSTTVHSSRQPPTTPVSANVKPRPRSFIDHTVMSNDVNGTMKKRWSDVHIGSKLHQAFDRLAAENSDEEYTDSLEPEINEKQKFNSTQTEMTSGGVTQQPPPQGVKFKRLQMKWEMLTNETSNRSSSLSDSSRTSNISSGSAKSKSPCGSPIKKEFKNKTPDSPINSPSSNTNKSKIPRLIPSPVRAHSTLTSASLQKSNIPKKTTGIPISSAATGVVKRQNTDSALARGKKIEHTTPTRSSRMDQHETSTGSNNRHPIRPTSLPYSQQPHKNSKLTPPRRAASSSLNRVNKGPVKTTPRLVRTLIHRLPSDNGHLSFNQGEKLTVMLEVDDKWLLCCRGSQKGLVPKSAVLVLE